MVHEIRSLGNSSKKPRKMMLDLIGKDLRTVKYHEYLGYSARKTILRNSLCVVKVDQSLIRVAKY